jgi:hypothetical protein
MTRWLLVLALGLTACGSAPADPSSSDPLGPDFDDPIWQSGGKEDSSASARVEQIEWDGVVYVSPGTNDAAALDAVKRQVKSALGAVLHSPGISLRDRDARSSVDPAKFQRQTLEIIGSDGASHGSVDRVRYHYHDLALVPKTYKSTTFSITELFGDYIARAGELSPICSDDPSVEPDSLWFHYEPGSWKCKDRIQKELDQINADTAALSDSEQQLSESDANRRFLTVRASLTSTVASSVVYPEYDRLFGFGSDRTLLVVYSFFGVDSDDADPHDWGMVEDLRYVRTLREAFPGLGVSYTNPQAMLLDFYVGGQLVPDVSYDQMTAWVLDGSSWPVGVTSSAQKSDLLNQVRDKLRERWIHWQLPLSVTYQGETRPITLELRTYYGREDGQPDWREAARNRYLDAFWNADVFSYTGHSHFGHGPLEPVEYGGGNFPDRYQVMLFNSCVSYNYYDIDFLEMHPGQSDNLDVVANGLPAYWPGMGESTAKYVIGLVDGENRSWVDILNSMRVDVSGLPSHYEPMRAVTGEEGNRFDPEKAAVSVELGAP